LPSVDLKTVGRLADLSRISLSAREGERLREELSSILGYFAELDRVDVSKVSLASPMKGDGGMRKDVVKPSTPRELLAGVPQKKGRFVRAPRVF